jgi:hypothetical protein
LLGVDAVVFSTGQFADGHLVRLGSAFDAAVAGGGQVAVPVGVGGCSGLGREDVDDARLGVVRKLHHRVDVLPAALAAAVMHQDHSGRKSGREYVTIGRRRTRQTGRQAASTMRELEGAQALSSVR